MRMYQSHAESKLQISYAEAVANETTADFAQANSNKDLGGLAALVVADQAYSQEFEKAFNFYGIASDALTPTFLLVAPTRSSLC